MAENNNVKKKTVSFYIVIPVIAAVTVLLLWMLCYPVSIHCAENRFESYMTEYNIDKSDIVSYKVHKGYTFANVEIEVEYGSDPDFIYSYSYPVCSFFNNKPEYVSIYTEKISPSGGVWYSSTQLYDLLKYPPVTRK